MRGEAGREGAGGCGGTVGRHRRRGRPDRRGRGGGGRGDVPEGGGAFVVADRLPGPPRRLHLLRGYGRPDQDGTDANQRHGRPRDTGAMIGGAPGSRPAREATPDSQGSAAATEASPRRAEAAEA